MKYASYWADYIVWNSNVYDNNVHFARMPPSMLQSIRTIVCLPTLLVGSSLVICMSKYITIGTRRYNFMQAINLEAKFEKVKTEVPILGKPGRGFMAGKASLAATVLSW